MPASPTPPLDVAATLDASLLACGEAVRRVRQTWRADLHAAERRGDTPGAARLSAQVRQLDTLLAELAATTRLVAARDDAEGVHVMPVAPAPVLVLDSGEGSSSWFGHAAPDRQHQEPLGVRVYADAIVHVLAAQGGSAPAGHVIDAVYAHLKGRFSAADTRLVREDRQQWRAQVHEARAALVDEGILLRTARGTWALSPKGRAYANGRRRLPST